MVKDTWNFTKLDVINAASSETLQNCVGETLTVTGIAIAERPDADGVVQDVGFFKTDKGLMSSISASILRVIPEIIDYLVSEGINSINMKVKSGTSNNDREFLTVEFIEE